MLADSFLPLLPPPLLQVANSTGLEVGQYIDLWYTDVDGKFNNLMCVLSRVGQGRAALLLRLSQRLRGRVACPCHAPGEPPSTSDGCLYSVELAPCRLNNLAEAPAKYANESRVKFTSKIEAIEGQVWMPRCPPACSWRLPACLLTSVSARLARVLPLPDLSTPAAAGPCLAPCLSTCPPHWRQHPTDQKATFAHCCRRSLLSVTCPMESRMG